MVLFPDPLDDEFPLGDGTVDSEAPAYCPYCGEAVELALDPGGGSVQDYVEDCPVCCSPWRVTVRWDAEGGAAVELKAEDDS